MGCSCIAKHLKAEPQFGYLAESTTFLKGGPLPIYNGEFAGHCLERWQFWKLRFSEVKDGVDEEVAKMVQQVVERWYLSKYLS